MNKPIKNWKIVVHYSDRHDERIPFTGTEEDVCYETLAAGYTIEADRAGITGADYEEMKRAVSLRVFSKKSGIALFYNVYASSLYRDPYRAAQREATYWWNSFWNDGDMEIEIKAM